MISYCVAQEFTVFLVHHNDNHRAISLTRELLRAVAEKAGLSQQTIMWNFGWIACLAKCTYAYTTDFCNLSTPKKEGKDHTNWANAHRDESTHHMWHFMYSEGRPTFSPHQCDPLGTVLRMCATLSPQFMKPGLRNVTTLCIHSPQHAHTTSSSVLVRCAHVPQHADNTCTVCVTTLPGLGSFSIVISLFKIYVLKWGVMIKCFIIKYF